MPQRAKIGIVVKPSDLRSQKVALELCEHLKRNKLDFLVDNEGATTLSTLSLAANQIVSRKEIVDLVDFVVTLGGDGTFISTARFSTKNSAQLIGVNVGTLGFLTEISPSDLPSVLELVLKGEAKVEKRAILAAKLITNSGTANQVGFSAINDIVIAKGALARIFGVTLYVNDIEAAYIRGDGVIVSSPLGSTAYSLAAGGSIVHPGVDALLVTPICPHSLTSRPLIIPGSSKISLKLDREISGPSEEVYLTVDGQEGLKLFGGSMVEVQTSPECVKMVTSPYRSYFQTLSGKLKWATH